MTCLQLLVHHLTFCSRSSNTPHPNNMWTNQPDIDKTLHVIALHDDQTEQMSRCIRALTSLSSPSIVHHPASIQEETYEALCRSIYLLSCLSCWVSASHVGALAVKTSADEVSADIAPLLNQWPLKMWQHASLTHRVRAEGVGCFIPGGEDAVGPVLSFSELNRKVVSSKGNPNLRGLWCIARMAPPVCLSHHLLFRKEVHIWSEMKVSRLDMFGRVPFGNAQQLTPLFLQLFKSHAETVDITGLTWKMWINRIFSFTQSI